MSIRQAKRHMNVPRHGYASQGFPHGIQFLDFLLTFATHQKMPVGGATHASKLIANLHGWRRWRQAEFLQDVTHVINLNEAARTVLHHEKMPVRQWLA